MDLNVVIAELRGRCPLFVNRVAGAAQFKQLDQNANFLVPAAYVIPLDEQAEAMRSQSGYQQDLKETIAVVVILSNEQDERGQASVNQALNDVRAQLWRCLLGWDLTDYGPFVYEGGHVLMINRSRLYYQFEFSADFRITPVMTRLGANFEALPDFEGVTLKVDYLDPGAGVPDGRIEHTMRADPPSV
ncbi:MAG: hypothetical protein AABY68_06100 [Pseudomonadota bacterium]